MINRVFLTSVFVFLFTSIMFANNWTLINDNNNVAAEKKMLKDLASDSTKIETIVGLIYLSELRKDKLAYTKYCKLLVNQHPTAFNFFLYQEKADFNLSQIEELDLPDNFKIEAQISEAEDLYSQRKFEESLELLDEVKSDLKWQVIGPFENICGSGYEIAYGPELNYKADKYDQYKHIFQQQWIDAKQLTAAGGVDFQEYLPKAYQQSTYYARSSFELKEDQNVTLNLSRSGPLKIWVDGNLAFEGSSLIAENFDFESISLSLRKGNHSVLVKSAEITRDFVNNSLFGVENYSYNYFDWSNFLSFNSFSSSFDNNFDFLVRITDDKGKKLNDIAIPFTNEYTTNSFTPNVKTSDIIEVLKMEIESAEVKEPYYYLLGEVFSKLQKSNEGEEYFYYLLKKNKDVLFYKYLLAKMYEVNKKSNEVYPLLEDVDHSKTPIFGLLEEKFDLLDKDTDEKKYLVKLGELNDICPSHRTVVMAYLNYYIDKGDNAEKKKYLEALVKEFPSLEEKYSSYLEDENYKPTIHKSKSDEDKKKEAMEALAGIDTSYFVGDYNHLITYYKNLEENDSVIYFYDELIKLEPSSYDYLIKKSRFLYGIEEYEQAQEGLLKALSVYPYREEVLELLGDISFDLKDENKALEYYESSLLPQAFNSSSYNFQDILSKIRKITPEIDYSDYLKGKTIEEVLKDKSWKNMYEDEQAIVIYSSQDIIFKKYNQIDLISKEVIKINSEEASRTFTEMDYAHFGKLTTVKVIKPNNVEVVPDFSGTYIVFKNLEPGDIVVVEGIIKDIPYIEDVVEGAIETDLYIQSYYPVYYTKFEIVAPKDYNLTFSYMNMEDLPKEPQIDTKKDRLVYKWEFNDVPKYIFEDGSLYDWEVQSFISLSSISEWNDLAQWYLKTTYNKIDFTYELEEVLDSLDLYNDAPQVQVEKIYNYITEQIDYSNVSFLQSNYIPKSPKLTCSEKIGDCKDVATLMLTLLRELDIESYYSLVRTNDYSMINFPPSKSFDHVIVAYKIDDKFEYIDLTSDYYPWFVMNDMNVGAFSLLIKEDTKDIFNLPNDALNDEKSKVSYTSALTFDGNDGAKLSSVADYYGMTGGLMKAILNQMTKEEIKPMLNDYISNPQISNLKIEEYSFENLSEISPSLGVNYDIQIKDFTSDLNDLVVFNIPFLSPLMENVVFQGEERILDFYPDFVMNTYPLIEEVSINIPEGNEMPKLPKDVTIHNDFMTYDLKFSMEGSKLMVVKEVSFLQRMVPKESFEMFRQDYFKMLKAENQKIYYSAI